MTALIQPAAGQALSAALLGTLVPKYAKRTTDATLSTTTLTADGVLFLTNLAINVDYEITLFMLSRSAGSVSISVDFTIPTGADASNFYSHLGSSGAMAETGANGAVSGIANTTIDRPALIRGILGMGSTSGTLQFRWACGTANPVIVAAGSYLLARQLS